MAVAASSIATELKAGQPPTIIAHAIRGETSLVRGLRALPHQHASYGTLLSSVRSTSRPIFSRIELIEESNALPDVAVLQWNTGRDIENLHRGGKTRSDKRMQLRLQAS